MPHPGVTATGATATGAAAAPALDTWLALREPEDARARSLDLARDAAALAARAAAGGPLVLHDLGSGTGAMPRWLAPRLPGPQRWVLHDRDPALTDLARQDRPRDRDGRAVAVGTRTGELGALRARDLAGAHLVTASALLDVLTADDLATIIEACAGARVPVLWSLSVVGSVTLDPADPRDAGVAAAFDDHQRRAVDGRRLLGPDAPALAARLLTEAGYRVRTAPTVWRLGPHEPELLATWLDGWIGAAAEHRPDAVPADYTPARTDAARRGALRATVGHVDLLGWAP